MPLNPQSFIAPLGNLKPEMFVGEDLPTRLERYLTEAADKVADLPDAANAEAMTGAWVYHRAYSALHAALLAAPSSTTLPDQGSVTWSGSQMAEVRRLADQYLAEFDELFLIVAAPPVIQASAATRTKVLW